MSLREADSKRPRNTMKDAPTQLDMRENTASSRRHASRRAMSDSLRQFDPSHSTESSDERIQELKLSTRETFELSLTDPDKEATGGGETATTASQQLLGERKRLSVERPLTCEEAAAFVRVHPKTVKRMARSGDLPGHFRFGRWFFYASELDCWMRTELHSSRHSCR
jgi:excisionase family DNA binding protein